MTVVQMPSCPWCTSNQQVVETEDTPRWPFFCVPCNLAFEGTDHEFMAAGYRRQMRREAAELRAKHLAERGLS